MRHSVSRRAALFGGAMLAIAGFVGTAAAADKPTLKFSAVFSDTDIRTDAMRMLQVRTYAQQKYLESDFAKAWPAELIDKINAM